MGKRSSFPRRERDCYPTPLSAVLPLLECLPPHTKFYEPCRGENDLVGHLTAAGHVLVGSSDEELDARTTQYRIPEDLVFVTNPPWDRPTLHAILVNLSQSKADVAPDRRRLGAHQAIDSVFAEIENDRCDRPPSLDSRHEVHVQRQCLLAPFQQAAA